MIQLIITGSGSPLPDPERAGPSTLVRAGSQTFLVDAGRGALMRVAAAGSSAAGLSALLVTHLHSDHITDLGDVLTTRWITTFSAEQARLPVIGPPGTAQMVDATLSALAPDIGYRMAHHTDLTQPPAVEVREVSAGVSWNDGGVTITAAPTDHRPVTPTIGHRIEHDGHSVVIAGDTLPCDSLDLLCAGADVLVITAIRKDLLAGVGLQRLEDVIDYHSSPEEAAMTAARAGVKTLVLTHCVPAPAAADEIEWRSRAAEHFQGEVIVARDLTAVSTGEDS